VLLSFEDQPKASDGFRHAFVIRSVLSSMSHLTVGKSHHEGRLKDNRRPFTSLSRYALTNC
jgi:hypothetical protein